MAPDPRYFFIIGAMKAGTTSLYNHLAGHPELYASPKKEPRVFRDAGNLEAQKAAFLALFQDRRDERWCFEGSTAYTKFPAVTGVPERLRAIVPDARFVYLVRDPVARIWSQYLHNLAHGRESRPFACAIKDAQYLDVSRYHRQLTEFLAVFPRERILVETFEEMVKQPLATVRAVCDFLEVDSSYTPATTTRAYNASAEKFQAPSPLRLLRSLSLEQTVPWRVRHWLKTRGAPLPAKEAVLTADIRAQIADALCEDTEAFFSWLGRRLPWPDFA